MSDTSEFSRLYELLSPLPRDQPVLISEGAALTASDLADRAQHLWTSLSAIPAGTRIATRLPDAPSTAFTLLALSHHVQVMALNPALTATETRSALAGSGARALLCLPDDPVARSLDIPCAHVSTDGDFIVPDIGGAQTDRATEWVGVVLMTSGSTGTPKRVPLTCAQLYRSADRIARALQLSEQDRAVHALPMFHIGALVDLLLAPLLAKGSVAFATGMGAGPLRDAVLQNSGTWMQLVPTMLNRLRADLSPEETSQMGAQLRFIRSVSSDLAPDVQTRAEALFAGTPIIQMFGMTETAGQITTNPLPPQTRKLGSVGRAFECGLRINDLDEIEVQSDAVTSGYEGLPRHAHFTNDGWLQTGDLGTIDEDGFVFLTGRAKEIINRGGEKISPHEIEHAALAAPGVTDAAAFAKPHHSLGEEVGLAVTLAKATDPAQVTRHLEARLAEFKLPRKIEVLEALPRLGSGKIDRRALTRQSPDAPEAGGTVHRSDIAGLVAEAWRAVLPETAPDGPADQTDFFDAGGDSLTGAQFVFEVERLTDRSLPPNLLFQAPEFGTFAAAVETAPLRGSDAAGDPKLSFLKDRLSTWDAAPVSGAPFFRRIDGGNGTPLFWCVQEEGEYKQLAQALTPDRPLFLMRSLFLMLGKDDRMSRDLARLYADDIARLEPEGPLLLGGFCEGAKIMRFVAEILADQGRDIHLLVSWDQWFDAPLSVPALHLWTDERFGRYAKTHVDPAGKIALAHPAGFDVLRIPGGHTEVLTNGPLAPILPALRQELDKGLQPAKPSVFGKSVTGAVRLTAPRFLTSGAPAKAQLTLTNTSNSDWIASSDQPLCVILQYRNLDGFTRPQIAAHHLITDGIARGETRQMSINLALTRAALPMWLMADVIDHKGTRASDHGLKQARRLIWVR